MKFTLACSLVALGLAGAASPVLAQGVYIGPGGVGVDTGLNRRYHDYDRDRYQPYYRDDEGRSVYRDHRYQQDREDQDQ